MVSSKSYIHHERIGWLTSTPSPRGARIGQDLKDYTASGIFGSTVHEWRQTIQHRGRV